MKVKKEIWARNIRLRGSSIVMEMRIPKRSVQRKREGSLEQVCKSSLRKVSQRGRKNKKRRESNFTKINREK